VEDWAVPGHWEGDLLFGSRNSQIATLVERQTRYVMLVKVAGKAAETIINALIKNARKLPDDFDLGGRVNRSLTRADSTDRRNSLVESLSWCFDSHRPLAPRRKIPVSQREVPSIH
jgi:hypothetical protein